MGSAYIFEYLSSNLRNIKFPLPLQDRPVERLWKKKELLHLKDPEINSFTSRKLPI